MEHIAHNMEPITRNIQRRRFRTFVYFRNFVSTLKPKTKNLPTTYYSLPTNGGFTLVETIIYAGLISIIIGLVLSVAFQIVEGSKRLNNKIEIEEEAHFIMKKFEWALTGVVAINEPTGGSSGQTLSVQKDGMQSGDNPIVFTVSDGVLYLKRGDGDAVQLNSNKIFVQDILFEHIPAERNAPEGIKTSITLRGRPYDIRQYNLTVHLRK